MPPTLVAATVGALLAAALLGAAYDRRSLALVVVAAAAPDLDALFGLAVPGATGAAFHNVWVPLLAGAALYWDTERRAASWLRGRYGWYGVRVAWVALAGYTVVGVGTDLFSLDGVALLYPLDDRYYALAGKFFLSSQEGVVQTYLGGGTGPLGIRSPGTTASHHVDSWLNPRPGSDAGTERRLDLLESGWQAVLVAVAAATLLVRRWS